MKLSDEQIIYLGTLLALRRDENRGFGVPASPADHEAALAAVRHLRPGQSE